MANVWLVPCFIDELFILWEIKKNQFSLTHEQLKKLGQEQVNAIFEKLNFFLRIWNKTCFLNFILLYIELELELLQKFQWGFILIKR